MIGVIFPRAISAYTTDLKCIFLLTKIIVNIVALLQEPLIKFITLYNQKKRVPICGGLRLGEGDEGDGVNKGGAGGEG